MFTRKNYGAIYVHDPDHIEQVKDIIKEMDEFEFDYLPNDLIKPFSDYPAVTYTHKFTDLDEATFVATCFSRGIYVWVYDARNEWPDNKIIKP